MVDKTKLVELLRYSHAEVARFADSLCEDERNTLGIGDQWSARDMLAHIIGSSLRSPVDFTAGESGETLPDDSDVDARNAEITAKYRRLPWNELRQRVDQALQDNLALVGRLTDEQLNDPNRYPFLEGRPAWRFFTSDAFNHSLASHLRPWYNTHGQSEYSVRLAEEETRLLLELDDSPEFQGVTIYNLACQYALVGRKEMALEKLAAGFQLNPGLKQYAHRDMDLVSLYGDPRFEALAPAPI